MRTRPILILTALLAASAAGPAGAQFTQDDFNRCSGNGSGSAIPADARIGYCNALIQGGRLTTSNLAMTYVNRGSDEIQTKAYDAAVADENNAIAIEPGIAAAYNFRGMADEDLNRYDDAIADYSKAIALNPGYAVAYDNRADAYGYKGQYDQVIADDTKAISLDASNVDFFNNRARGYMAKNEFDQAEPDVLRAAAMSPQKEAYRYNCGWVHEHQGKTAAAIADYQQALALDPTDDDVKKALTRLGAAP